MAQQKIQSVQLSDSGVVPGAYTLANVTVDLAGRITAISNGSSGDGTVTSVSIDGSVGRITSSGGPITDSGIITLDLATTTVTPGVYTSADITIDAYGRITAAANGAASIVEPLNQVVYGTGSGVTSSPDLTFVDATNTLTVGGTDPGFVSSAPGQPLTLASNNGANTIRIETTGDLSVNGSIGTNGQVLTSAGTGAPPTWETPAAGALQMNVFTLTGGSGTFSGTVINNWSSVDQRDENTELLWDFTDPYTGAFECLINGVYEIVVEAQIIGDAESPSFVWPDELTAYGVDMPADYPALNTTPQTKVHTRYSPPGSFPNLSGNFGLAQGSLPGGSSGTTASFTERYIVQSDVGGIVYPRLFAFSYTNGSPLVYCSMSISFMRISAYSPE